MSESTFPLIHRVRASVEDAKRRELLHHLTPAELEQTLAEYANHFKLSSRERARLVAESLAIRAHDTGSRIKNAGKRAVKHVSARVAHAASHKLMDMARRIEHRAQRLDQDE
ncbi:hypothetical protein LG200_00560 [Methylobacillus caricis]|uniref:hypothetical protein n=1 Tax=Methylobacillus caricis TaxID=1971611 RepID=UPI001D001189|nr:hypothetical protein [Methylobacillus caricis]MCB5186494.1 hypothetical protein [Methylobacillus caricis]